MLDISALIAQQNSPSDSLNLKLIFKLPKDYDIGEVLVSLMMLAEVELVPVGKISGMSSDRFNWCDIEMSGSCSAIMDAALYLQILSVEVLEIHF